MRGSVGRPKVLVLVLVLAVEARRGCSCCHSYLAADLSRSAATRCGCSHCSLAAVVVVGHSSGCFHSLVAAGCSSSLVEVVVGRSPAAVDSRVVEGRVCCSLLSLSLTGPACLDSAFALLVPVPRVYGALAIA